MKLIKHIFIFILLLIPIYIVVLGNMNYQNETAINIKVNEPLILRFPLIGDGGYWLLKSFDTTKVEFISKIEEHPKALDTVGNILIFIAGGGNELWTFRIHCKGIYLLNFYYKYARPTEKNWQQLRKIIVN
jgi:hypothetical protein